MFKLALVQALVGSALAGTVIWDGRFNEFSSSTDLNNWSWSNQVGPYQYYIHGSAAVTQYVNLSPSYKNPADTASNQGVKISIDKTAYWNGQNMRRTELIPQTSAGINQGRVYYHFSVKRTNTNAPRADLEHQVNFFESHFTELKYGLLSGASGSSDPTLKWCVSGQTKWSVTFDADVWHNVAYDIDFSANQVSFWHSTGSDPLVLTAGPFSVSTSSNGADWHLGVLRLPMNSDLQSSDVEDWYFSGVYVESGSLNTQIGSGVTPTTTRTTTTAVRTTTTSSTTTQRTTTGTTFSTTIRTTTTTSPTTTARTTTPSTTRSTTAATTTTSASGSPPANKWGQCGGIGWTGATTCVDGSTCQALNPYYSQCL
ncbi:hypothetical protein TWF569_007933 [Orbilia oligospora]|uniref:CBM1 domain-containing protein n=1 Tax=Orbilia oligospora TaxID=2813651 RepID=A0A7C8JIZ7_ORBOL|nr:hypothetical protein TWF102_000366 [Orbilia oligospora]KAF3113822.1 hypothetical protein TWF706_009192 [Orbilia oligospora]KAF3115932.1 hypothetical protein TWF103_010161 [Orbilia oligospora]KAF3138244.1 hypothetical protein TWF703_004773 [Orbilia oligospora]KAF3149629.1 hypothetical protein TWF594_010730 [Orbilia oligospora]